MLSTIFSERLLLEEKLSAKLTDEVCRKIVRKEKLWANSSVFSTSSAPTGHLLLKEKAFTSHDMN